MDPITGEDLFQLNDRLDPILKTLISIKEGIERTKPSILIDHYFGILTACRNIQEAKETLAKIARGSKHKGTEKNFHVSAAITGGNAETSAPQKGKDE